MEKKQKVHNPKILFVYICLIIGVLGMEAGGLQYNLLLIAEELGLSVTQMGNLASAQYVAFILIPILFGGLGDRYGKKAVMILFGISFSVGCLAVIVSQGFLLTAAGIFFMGAGYSMCESTGTSLLSDMFHEDSSRYINWSQSCFSTGALLSPLLSQLLCDVAGLSWRVFFSILLVLYAAFALWAMSLRFPQKSVEAGRTEGSEGLGESGENAGKSEKEEPIEAENGIEQRKRMAGGTSFMMICLAAGITIYAGMESGIGYFIGTHVSHVLGVETYNSLALSLFWLLMIPSRYLAGILKNHPRRMLKLCFLCSALSIVLVLLMTTRNGLLVGYALTGCFFGPIWPLIMGEAGNLDPDNSARISGAMIACCGLGGVIAPTLFGMLADHFSLTASLLFVVGLTAAGLACTLCYARLWKKYKGRAGA